MQIPWLTFRRAPTVPAPASPLIPAPLPDTLQACSDVGESSTSLTREMTSASNVFCHKPAPVNSALGHQVLPQLPNDLQGHFLRFAASNFHDEACSEHEVECLVGGVNSEHVDLAVATFFTLLPEGLRPPAMNASQLTQEGLSQACLDALPLALTGPLLQAVTPLGTDAAIFIQLSRKDCVLSHFHRLPVLMREVLEQPEGPAFNELRALNSSLEAIMAVAETQGLIEITAQFGSICPFANTVFHNVEEHVKGRRSHWGSRAETPKDMIKSEIVALHERSHNLCAD